MMQWNFEKTTFFTEGIKVVRETLPRIERRRADWDGADDEETIWMIKKTNTAISEQKATEFALGSVEKSVAFSSKFVEYFK